MWHQLFGTAIGTIFAPPYACLTMGYLEITKLYPQLALIFSIEVCRQIEEAYKRYMDDGITALPVDVGIDVFQGVLNNRHPGLVFTVVESFNVNIN
jgi:hypothetical protein